MRRAVPILLATLLGLLLLANFHTSPAPMVSSAAPAAGSSASVTTRPPVAGASPPPTADTATARTVDGPAVANRYGTVQVEVTLAGDRIVDVQALQLPNDRAKSQQISSFVEPRLRQEVLTAQSAQVDTVSGATYTSLGYQQSLQAALDRAGRP